jgi:hypothetical protein
LQKIKKLFEPQQSPIIVDKFEKINKTHRDHVRRDEWCNLSNKQNAVDNNVVIEQLCKRTAFACFGKIPLRNLTE